MHTEDLHCDKFSLINRCCLTFSNNYKSAVLSFCLFFLLVVAKNQQVHPAQISWPLRFGESPGKTCQLLLLGNQSNNKERQKALKEPHIDYCTVRHKTTKTQNREKHHQLQRDTKRLQSKQHKKSTEAKLTSSRLSAWLCCCIVGSLLAALRSFFSHNQICQQQ